MTETTATCETRRPKMCLGEFSGHRVARIQAVGWGRCYIDRKLSPAAVYEGEPWILDNGAYRQFLRIQKGEQAEYDFDRFHAQVGRATELLKAHRFPMAVAIPDRVAEGWDSLVASMEALHELTADDDEGGVTYQALLPYYLVVQDGMTPEGLDEMACPVCDMPILHWSHGIAGIFLGGSNWTEKKAPAGAPVRWKEQTAEAWATWAHENGLKVHWGRCSTPRLLELAYRYGFDSADSACPMWSEAKWTSYEDAWKALGSPAALIAQLDLPAALIAQLDLPLSGGTP